jgi:hypothetical protein
MKANIIHSAMRARYNSEGAQRATPSAETLRKELENLRLELSEQYQVDGLGSVWLKSGIKERGGSKEESNGTEKLKRYRQLLAWQRPEWRDAKWVDPTAQQKPTTPRRWNLVRMNGGRIIEVLMQGKEYALCKWKHKQSGGGATLRIVPAQ